MAIVIAKNSNLNDDFWNEWSNIMANVMKDVDTEKNDYDEIVRSLFVEKKSNRFGEKASGMTSFGNFAQVAEGAAAPLDDLQEGFSKLLVHNEFMKKAIATAEMAEDNNVDAIKAVAANFIRSYKRSRAEWATACLTAEGTTFTYGGKTYDKTTGDGKALFATDHPGKKPGVANQSNVYTNAFGTNSTMLNRLANIGRNFRNASGHVEGYTFDTIIIPGNCYALEDTIKSIIRSDLVVGSSNNDINTQKGLWNLIVDPLWQAASGTAPYILMSSQANKEKMGSVFFDRIPLTMKDQVDLDTHNLEWSGRARWISGFYAWDHVIMGGAQSGTTLT